MFAYCPKNKIFGIFFLFFLSFVFYLFSFSPVSAQGLDFGVATTYKLDDKNLESGDILSISPGKNILERSSTNYDQKRRLHHIFRNKRQRPKSYPSYRLRPGSSTQ